MYIESSQIFTDTIDMCISFVYLDLLVYTMIFLLTVCKRFFNNHNSFYNDTYCLRQY